MGLLRRLLRRSSGGREWNWNLSAASAPALRLESGREEPAGAGVVDRLPRTKVMLGFAQGDDVHLPDDDARSAEMRKLADEIWLGRKVGSRAT